MTIRDRRCSGVSAGQQGCERGWSNVLLPPPERTLTPSMVHDLRAPGEPDSITSPRAVDERLPNRRHCF